MCIRMKLKEKLINCWNKYNLILNVWIDIDEDIGKDIGKGMGIGIEIMLNLNNVFLMLWWC